MRKLLFFLTMVLLSVSAVTAQGDPPALIRFANLPLDAQPANPFVDGSAAANPDGSAEIVSPASVTLYRPYDAGAHQVSLMMMDGGAAPLSLDITAEAGHRYTLAVLGSGDDLKTEWIDETAGIESAGIDPASSPQLFVNNLKGAPALDIALDGKPEGLNVGYGEFAFLDIPPANYTSLDIIAAADAETNLFTTPIFFEPSTAYIVALTGDFSGGPDSFGAAYTFTYSEYSPRNAADFLAGFSGLGLGFAAFPPEIELPFQKQVFSFDTALKAFETAGLSSILSGSDEHTIFVPTDDAFAALPAGTLEALMADPQKLRDLLLYHVADGRVGFEQLAAWGKIKTLQGGDLTVAMSEEQALNINDQEAGCGCNYDVANGHIYVLDHVLMPKA